MKLNVKIFFIISFFVLIIPTTFGQFVDWKQQVVQYVNIASTPSSPDQYTWHEETVLGQGVHINIVPTKISKIYLESGNAKICFGSFIDDYDCSTYFYRLDVNIDDQGYSTIYNDDLLQTYVWNVSSIFTSVGAYDLKIRYYCAVPAVTYSREYKIFVVPPSDALFRDQYHNSIRLWKSPNTNATPLLLSPGFDAYNVKTEQYYRYAGSKLIECLNNNGFDIYVLYYKYNPQDMRNNAAIYSSAVNYISTNFYNSGNIVAAGISMGAVITRYALSKAEDDETPLPVDRWISLDGPHQGAYIESVFNLNMLDNI